MRLNVAKSVESVEKTDRSRVLGLKLSSGGRAEPSDCFRVYTKLLEQNETIVYGGSAVT